MNNHSTLLKEHQERMQSMREEQAGLTDSQKEMAEMVFTGVGVVVTLAFAYLFTIYFLTL